MLRLKHSGVRVTAATREGVLPTGAQARVTKASVTAEVCVTAWDVCEIRLDDCAGVEFVVLKMTCAARTKSVLI